MSPKNNRIPPHILSRRWRHATGALILSLALIALAGAIAIPFYFESSSILYKFGLDRWLLLSAQATGLIAGVLLIVQIILGARIKLLDRVFGLNTLYKVHRLSGMVMVLLVLIHPILIFISDDRLFIPFQLRYWPEFVGLFLLVMMALMVATANWRTRLGIAFDRWWPLHRIAAVLVVAAFLLHLLFASDTFEQEIPRLLAYSAVALSALIFAWIWTRAFRNRRSVFGLNSIESAGKDAVRLTVSSENDEFPAYAPGQFAFLSFNSGAVSKEEHPFTVASTPTRPSSLEFIIRTTGDWTRRLGNMQSGDTVRITGPFGLFSYLRLPEKKEIVMIAGGIGITPMLSMLRHMADTGDQRKISLIWSNQTDAHIIAEEEFREIESKLNGLQIQHVLTRKTAPNAKSGRLDRNRLMKLLSECSVSALVLICGPDQMIKDICRQVKSLGFRSKNILSERFSL